MRCRDLPALLVCPLKSSCRKHFCSVINQSKCKLSLLCSSSGSYRAYLSSNFMTQPPSKSSSSNTSNSSYSFNITNSIPTSCNRAVSIFCSNSLCGMGISQRKSTFLVYFYCMGLACLLVFPLPLLSGLEIIPASNSLHSWELMELLN